MIKDKGLDRLLYGIFGVGGIAILIFALVQPMTLSGKIQAISVGSIGLLFILIRVLLSRYTTVKK